MQEFEVMYIVSPIDKTIQEETIKKINDVITKNNGQVSSTDIWGLKRLAYKIKDLDDGYYVLTKFSGTSETIKELDLILKLDENILRHVIVKKAA